MAIPSGFMTEKQVRRKIPAKKWQLFCGWMAGQTCPVLEDGSFGYYRYDVERFVDYYIDNPRPESFEGWD